METKCSKCGEMKPNQAFKVRLTREQAAKKGYAGNVMVDIEVKQCKDCRPKRKPLKEHTAKQLHNLMVYGDIPKLKLEVMMENKRNAATWAQSAGPKKRWQAKRDERWDVLLEAMRLEIESTHQQQKYAKKKACVKVTGTSPIENTEESVTLKYTLGYLRILRAARVRAQINKRVGERAPTEDWAVLLTQGEVNEVHWLWDALAMTLRMKMRQPYVVSARRVTASAAVIWPVPDTQPTVQPDMWDDLTDPEQPQKEGKPV